MDKLMIKDLQKGMMIIFHFDPLNSYIVLVVDCVRVNPDHVVGISYAIGMDETGKPYLLTNEDELILYEEKEKKQGARIPVICSMCGKQMIIKEWMQANLHGAWTSYGDRIIPHMNRSHPCSCGHLWLSTDALVDVGNILVWEYCS